MPEPLPVPTQYLAPNLFGSEPIWLRTLVQQESSRRRPFPFGCNQIPVAAHDWMTTLRGLEAQLEAANPLDCRGPRCSGENLLWGEFG